MKMLFRAIILGKQKTEYKEIIAATPADAAINAIQEHTGVIEMVNVPWHKMTSEQKIKVIEADCDEHNRRLRASVSLDDSLAMLGKMKDRILNNNSEICKLYKTGIVT